MTVHNLESQALRDAPMCHYKYDLIMFTPPVGGQRQVYTEIASQLASLGFLAITIDHPSISGAVEMSNGSILYNVVGETLGFREAGLVQTADLNVVRAFVADASAEHSPLWAQTAEVNPNSTCVLGHGLGGSIAMRMIAKDMISCGMNLDNRMPMPAPFSEKDILSSTQKKNITSSYSGDSKPDADLSLDYFEGKVESAAVVLGANMANKLQDFSNGMREFVVNEISRITCHVMGTCDDFVAKRSLPEDGWGYG